MDISQFCELEWFKWVMFQDETAPFPDDVLKLGHYLGPSIDVGPAMTAKILTENGQVLHRSNILTFNSRQVSRQKCIRCLRMLESMIGWGPPSFQESLTT